MNTIPEWAIAEGDPNFSVVENKQNRLGNGSFGCVFIANYYGAQVAAKTIFMLRNPVLYDENDLEFVLSEIRSELDIQAKLRHPNLLSLIGAVINTKNHPVWLLSEYMPHGSLEKLLKKFPSPYVVQISSDIFRGLMYLHDKMKGMHRDIKPANVLISSDGTCKLCDFGLAKLGVASSKNTLKGTPQYMAPEVASGKYTLSVDVWSAGVLIVELILGNLVTCTPEHIPQNEGLLASGKFPDMKKVINASVVVDPKLRGSAQSLLRDMPVQLFPKESLLVLLTSPPKIWTSIFGLPLVETEKSSLKFHLPRNGIIDKNSNEFITISNVLHRTILNVHRTFQLWPYSKLNIYRIKPLYNQSRWKNFEKIDEPMCLCVHGTSSNVVDAIVQNGFNHSTCGAFGSGIYLGENSSVGVVFAQKYAFWNTCYRKKFYSFSKNNVWGKMTMILCLVKPGTSETCDGSTVVLPNVEDVDIFGITVKMTKDRISQKNALIAHSVAGYRELVMYDNDRVYPAYSITFWPEFFDRDESIDEVIAARAWFYSYEQNYFDAGRRDDLLEIFTARPQLLSTEIYAGKFNGHIQGLYGLGEKNGRVYHDLALLKNDSPPYYTEFGIFKKAPLLHWAIYYEKFDFAMLLLDAGANALAVSSGGVTVAMIPCKSEKLKDRLAKLKVI